MLVFLLFDHSMAMILVHSLLNVTSVGREPNFLLSFTRIFYVSVGRGSVFRLVYSISSVMLVLHSLYVPYNYYA